MDDLPNAIAAKERAWIARQIAHPAPVYILSDLRRLCGPNAKIRRLRRMLIRKGVLEQTVGKGRDHLVLFSKLTSMWPDLWHSIRRSWQEAEARLEDEQEEQDEAA